MTWIGASAMPSSPLDRRLQSPCERVSWSLLLRSVAILDSTVKIFYDDSLKFFLSLYGHKLPVMSMDISDDGTMLATGSADKTIKIWGLDFGDCHRSILAHDDSVMVRPRVTMEGYIQVLGVWSKFQVVQVMAKDSFKRFSGMWHVANPGFGLLHAL